MDKIKLVENAKTTELTVEELNKKREELAKSEKIVEVVPGKEYHKLHRMTE